MAVTKIEKKFSELMPANDMSFTISAKEESYQNSDASLVTNESNQLNYTNNNNTYFYDEMGNRIECELMNEDDLVVIDLPEDMPSVIPNDVNKASFNHIEPSSEMDQNYNCDASDDGSVRSFQTVFYNENGVNHDPEPMDIEMNEQEEILKEQIEEPQEIANLLKVEQQATVKERKHGHRRILIEEEENEKVVNEEKNNHQEILNQQNEEHQEMLQELSKDENVVTNENVDLENKCKVEPVMILNTKNSNDVKEEKLSQSLIKIVEAENIAEDDENIVETKFSHFEDNKDVHQQHTKITMVVSPSELPAQGPDSSWRAEEYYQSPNDPQVQEKLDVVYIHQQQTKTEEIIASQKLPAQDITLDTSWSAGGYYIPTNDPEVQEKMNVVDVYQLQPKTYEIIASQEMPAQIPADEYYQSTNEPDVQEKMNVIDIPCTSSAGQDEYEDLMKSIDFNSLVLAESEVDGKTINEIYTMDSITEEISEKPLNLPQHVVDKIVSILNSADSDDEDA